MAIARTNRRRRIAEDIAFFVATMALAWWAIDHDPPWVMAAWTAGAFVAAFMARWWLVRCRVRRDRVVEAQDGGGKPGE